MKEIRLIMGMPVTVDIVDAAATSRDLDDVFAYFRSVDERFSTYKTTSEISAINRGELQIENASAEMREVFALSEETKRATDGSFDIRRPDGSIDPSGLVKGWAIHTAATLIAQKGFKNYFVDAGGDIEAHGLNAGGKPWTVGIRNPFGKENDLVKVVRIENGGIATSGSYIRGEHIYNPRGNAQNEIVSITVIGPNIYDADRFATAAFVMGRAGIAFIDALPGFEGYMIDKNGIATMTRGFNQLVC